MVSWLAWSSSRTLQVLNLLTKISHAFVSCMASVSVKMRTDLWWRVRAYQADKLVLRGAKVGLTINCLTIDCWHISLLYDPLYYYITPLFEWAGWYIPAPRFYSTDPTLQLRTLIWRASQDTSKYGCIMCGYASAGQENALWFEIGRQSKRIQQWQWSTRRGF